MVVGDLCDLLSRAATLDRVDHRPEVLQRGVELHHGAGEVVGGDLGVAAPARQIEAWLTEAGFVGVSVALKPESREMIAQWAPGRGVENYVAAAIIEARKPAA